MLAYPKFKLTSAEIRGLIEEALLPFIVTVRTSPSDIPKLRDPDDAKLIICAVTAGVRWLVSGDDDLLSLHRIKPVEIVSVTAFLEHIKRKPCMWRAQPNSDTVAGWRGFPLVKRFRLSARDKMRLKTLMAER